jgi:nuclear GTP-binding protein
MIADNTRKSYYREFKKVVERSDVIMQVLDARDPLACRCEDVERYVRSVDPNKKIILILNKVGVLSYFHIVWGASVVKVNLLPCLS